MEIRKRTPRTDLLFSAIAYKMRPLMAEIAAEMGVEDLMADVALSDFAQLSTRIDLNGDEVDFALAQASDDLATIRAKFRAYLDTNDMSLVDRAIRGIAELDRPLDRALAPQPPEQTEKN